MVNNLIRYVFIIGCLFVFSQDSFCLITADCIVAKDGSGNFLTIQDALNAVPSNHKSPYTIFIKKGIYNEKIRIEKSFINLIGENRDNTRIIFAELRSNWKTTHPTDYGSSVINIKDSVTDLVFINLTIYNNYGSLFGSHDHQFAIRGGGSRIIIVDCNIIADGGDTISLWNGTDGMYYHKNCYFEGYVDYVCPRGWCYITNSVFYGHNLTASIWTDGSKNKDQKLVIKNSRFDGAPGFPLGRHHLDAQFYLLECSFSNRMADKPIIYVGKDGPMKWGERDYYYNCHGDSIDYQWHRNNLETAAGSPKFEQITPRWVFNGKWDPEAILSKLMIPDSK